MLDPMTSLAFSVYSGKGVHALLLGSGISRSSGIMTGWQIVLDLIKKFAAVEGEDWGDKPDEWYRAKYRREPDYSELLNKLANTSAERMNLLRAYFEADEADREANKKQPTPAHHAIARLVTDGYIRVIVTTNFDRLMERALEAAGVVPSVIASPNSILGAAPLFQSRCTVIKVHGDYLDTRLKNTPEELAKYDPALKRLLRQVFDEYGLIVCGWSAEWDTALKASIEGCPSRRYTMYWSAFRGVAQNAAGLCQKRDAQVINDMDADQFFTALADKVAVLKEMEAPHPLSKSMAVAALKKYMVEDRYRIKLEELVLGEADKVALTLFSDLRNNARDTSTPYFESKIEVLLSLIAAGGYWGLPKHRRLWLRCFQLLVTPRSESLPGLAVAMDYYPAYLILWAYGIAALASGRLGNVAYILAKGTAKTERGTTEPLVCRLDSVLRLGTLDEAVKKADPLLRSANLFTSRYVRKQLREPLRFWIPEDSRYEELFTQYEYLTGLVTSHLFQKEHQGPFGATNGLYLGYPSLEKRFDDEINKFGDKWPFLRAGLFDGSLLRLRETKAGFDEDFARLRTQFRFG
jgi:SIR2-like domain